MGVAALITCALFATATGIVGAVVTLMGLLALPQMLKEKGYATAMYGKWHIGMTFFDKEGKALNKNGLEPVKRIDYSRSIPDGPIHRGFDKFFGTVCCPTTDWLYAYVEGDRIPVPPTHIVDRGPLPKHPYAHDNRPGMIAPDFDLEEVDVVFMEKSIQFMEEHVKTSPDQPFFLFHSAQAVHLPSFPGDAFKGKTDSGPHGDFIFELDHIVGELMKTLERLGIAENTLIMFSSDNGPEVTSVIHMRKDHNHDGSRPWRGMKRDAWEAGHRVPFVARWPGRIKPGSRSHQLTSLTDLMATCGAIVGTELPNEAAEDSFNILPVLLGEDGGKPIRKHMLQQTIRLSLSIREGHWKYLDHKGSGGNNYGRGHLRQFAIEDTAPDAPGQLYDLAKDPGEKVNVADRFPEVVKRLKDQ
ncbi:MAG: sulfatase-like hydrolase/transferase, partial [Verrucomicrobiota bacterium]